MPPSEPMSAATCATKSQAWCAYSIAVANCAIRTTAFRCSYYEFEMAQHSKREKLMLVKFVTLFLCFGAFTGFLISAELTTVDVSYDAHSGAVSVETDLHDGVATVHLVSNSGIFIGDFGRGAVDQGLHRLVFGSGSAPHLTTSHHFADVAATGLTDEFLLSDLCIHTNDIGNRIVVGSINGYELDRRIEQCVVPPNPNLLLHNANPTATLHYDSGTGNLSVDVSENTSLTTILISSPTRIFTGEPASGLGHRFDVDLDNEIFKVVPSGFGDIDFGNVLPTGLSNNEVLSSICVVGSWLHGGPVYADYQLPDSGTVPIATHEIRRGERCMSSSNSVDLNLEYSTENGDVAISIGGADGLAKRSMSNREIVALELNSDARLFRKAPKSLLTPNDSFAPNRVIKHSLEGFSGVVFERLLEPGLPLNVLLDDISADVITATNSRVGALNVIYVPEPCSTRSALIVGVLLCLRLTGMRQNKMNA